MQTRPPAFWLFLRLALFSDAACLLKIRFGFCSGNGHGCRRVFGGAGIVLNYGIAHYSRICYNTLMDLNDPRVEENFAELTAMLANSDDSGFISDFLRCLLTPAEIADIAARWALVKALKRKVPHRVIAKDYGISLCKITRGSRALKQPDSAFARFFSSDGAAEGRGEKS